VGNRPPNAQLLRLVPVPAFSNDVDDVMTMQEKRHNRRIQVTLPISFMGKDKGIGIVRNLSRGGCQMECMADLAAQDSLIMYLTLSPDEAPLIIEAASVRRYDEHLFSVAFLVMDTKEQEKLRLYLSQFEKEQRPKGTQ
jgi:c-di-GMP-binding flagellar brake protein YcgR